ncbi:MAG: hypothetical protein CMM25_08655 [Rhodospirillaceae bacterium]|nr:hypothetical protein [Rhodospirillaceae bacterium]
MTTPTKKRGRKKKDATALVAQELSQITSPSDNTTIQSSSALSPDIDEINISFGSSSGKKPTTRKKSEKAPAPSSGAEKRSVSFGGLNITVHSAAPTDISSVAHSLRFGSQTADNAEAHKSGGSGDSSDKMIHGRVDKKVTLRSTPSRMCEIVERDSTDEETEDPKPETQDDQVSVRSAETQPAPFIWNRPPENTRALNLSRRIGDVFKQHGNTELPTTSNVWCWWCCHNFETTPCFLPTFYDEIRKRFVVVGNFCSWPCVKAYNIEQKDMCIHKRNAILRILLRRCGIKSEQIKTAPPRAALRTMGGNLSIDEFRRSSGIYEMMKPLSSMTICIEPQTLLKKTQKLMVKR